MGDTGGQSVHDEHQRLALAALGAAALVIDDDDFRCELVSDASEALLGYPAARWREPWFLIHVLHEDDRASVTAALRAAAVDDRLHECPARLTDAEGAVHALWLRVRRRPGGGLLVLALERDGPPASTAGGGSTLPLQTFLSQSPLAVFAVDERGAFRWVEGAEGMLFGVARDRLVGQPAARALSHLPWFLRHLERARQGRAYSARGVTAGASFLIHYGPWGDATGRPRGVLGVALDV
ncbi:MAG: PAS domain-containing protein, partial [Myxococcales bacterium]